MNCGNCNTPLIPGNNICPNCGAVNMPPSTPTPTASVPSFDFEEITPTTPEVEVPVEITANMAPPSLDVNKEDLESGATDISQANISTYGEEVVETPSEPVNNTNDKVDFDIPSVQKPVENIEMPSDGSAPSIDTGAPTVGEIEENVPTVKIGKKKIKLNIHGNKSVPQLICIILVVLFFVFGIFLGKVLFSKTVYANNRITNNQKVPTIADGKNNITKAGNFEFKIPEKFYYDRNNEGLLVYDGKANWRIYIRADQGRYEDLAKAKKSVKETLIESSVSVNEIKETKKDKRSILVIEGTTKNDNRLIAFSDATHDYIFYIEIVDATNNYDYEALDVAIDIINNATYKESPSKLEDKTVYDISEIVIRASEEYKALTKK